MMNADRFAQLRYRHDFISDYGLGPPSQAALEQREALRLASLARCIKVGPELTPRIDAIVRHVCERLQLDAPIEVYVYNAPEAQAVSMGGEDAEPLAIAMTSGIVELLPDCGLDYVIGHELGHHLFGHHHYPDEDRSRSPVERMNLLSLHRAAEISADRIGFLASASRDGAFRAIIRLASGLSDDFLRMDVPAYLDQQKEFVAMGGSEHELASTHPLFTVRLRALLLFEMSTPYWQWRGMKGKAPLSAEVMDDRIERDMAAVCGFRLLEINEEAVKSALLWSVLAVFVSDNRLTRAEQALIKRTFGEDRGTKVIEFAREFGPDAVHGKLEEALRGLRLMRRDVRETLYEDIGRFAVEASGGDETKRRVLHVIAARLALDDHTT